MVSWIKIEKNWLIILTKTFDIYKNFFCNVVSSLGTVISNLYTSSSYFVLRSFGLNNWLQIRVNSPNRDVENSSIEQEPTAFVTDLLEKKVLKTVIIVNLSQSW